ncbi:MAG: flippase [Bacteroidota bacterium]
MKDSKRTYWLKSGSYTLMERVAVQLFRFGGFYFLVRAFSKKDFGIWALFLIVSAVIEVARMGLIQNALIKFLAGTDRDRVKGRINTASLVLNILLTLFVAVILGLFVLTQASLQIDGISKLAELLYWYIFTSISLIPFFQFNFIQQANFDFRGIFFSNVIRQGMFFGFVLYGYFGNREWLTLSNLAVFQIICALVGGLVSWAFGRKYLIFSARLDRNWFRWLFGYGKYVVGTNIASMFIKSIDQMMLFFLVSPAAVAIYNTAIKISNLVEVPTQSLAAIVYPKSVRQVETKGQRSLKKLYEKSVGILLAMIVPMIILVLIFPTEVLWFVAGDKYLDAAPVLRVTMLFGLFVPFARQFGTMMDAMGHPRVNFMLVMISAVCNLVFNFVFIKVWDMGVMGAAYATLLTFSILFVVNQIILYRKLNVKAFRTLFYAQKAYWGGIALVWKRIATIAK